MTTSRSRLIEDVARAIHGHAMVIQRRAHVSAREWENLEPAAQEAYRGMARAAIGCVHAHRIVFPTLLERARRWWKANVVDEYHGRDAL